MVIWAAGNQWYHSNAVLSTLPEPAQTSALDGLLSNTLTATELIKYGSYPPEIPVPKLVKVK